MKIADLQKLETEAQKLVQHAHEGKSPFTAPLRSALGRAIEMAAEHEKWLAANPEPKPEATPPAK